ncbi:hypothetical protein COMA2_240023 [Candidatus Nitrospira nitrificans]|uniref:Uncharacterized protein n=1 Tax=Candidatus Nitrospira nitrificans TaxID=1742973 RepID=A0A0S4LIZ0_9BACT|nr:hypothetical protein COMA2_240023 [Candidatus Nitrospira nitrificans]
MGPFKLTAVGLLLRSEYRVGRPRFQILRSGPHSPALRFNAGWMAHVVFLLEIWLTIFPHHWYSFYSADRESFS